MSDLSLIEPLIETSLKNPSAEDIHSLDSAMCQALGFDYFLYDKRFPTSFVNPEYVIISGLTEQFWQHYNDEGYMEIGPTVLHCTTRVMPLHWEDIPREQGGSGPRVKRFMSEAWNFAFEPAQVSSCMAAKVKLPTFA